MCPEFSQSVLDKPVYDIIFPIGRLVPSTRYSIASALDQSLLYTSFIAIIDTPCDQISSDICDALSSVPRCICIRTYGLGPGAARQVGINNATSPYLAFLDSDDVWHQSKMEFQLSQMIATCSDISFTSYLICDSSFSRISSVALVPRFFTKYLLLLFNPIGNSTVVCTLELICSVGGYSSLPARNDFATWLKIFFCNKVSCLSIVKPFVLVVKNANSVSRRSKGLFLIFRAYRSVFPISSSIVFSVVFSISSVFLVKPCRFFLPFFSRKRISNSTLYSFLRSSI